MGDMPSKVISTGAHKKGVIDQPNVEEEPGLLNTPALFMPLGPWVSENPVNRKLNFRESPFSAIRE